MKKHLIIILLAIVGLFLGMSGFAQEKSSKPAEGERMNAFMVEKIIGSKVINVKGEALGKIEDLVPDFPNYSSGTWGPAEADRIITGDGGWHNPKHEEAIG